MSIRQRLYPTAGQESMLVEHTHQARYAYNISVRQWMDAEKDEATGKWSSSPATRMRQVTERRADLDWFRAGSSVVQQGAVRDFERAAANFYAGRSKAPTFHRKNDRDGSFVIRDLTVRRLNRKWAVVTVPKVGLVRFRLTRAWHEVVGASGARISHRNGQWHLSLTTPPRAKQVAGSGEAVGIDRGVKNTLALSDGRMLSLPQPTPAEQARFLRLQQRLARQVKGSKRREATKDALGVIRRRTEDRARDWIEQTTTVLARGYDLIAVEDLKVVNMVAAPSPRPDPETEGAFLPNGARAKAALNRLIHASRWGRILTRLTDKTDAVVLVDPAHTSQECRACGHTSPDNRESQAVFRCVKCGHEDHADTNAAGNILARALALGSATPQPADSGGSRNTPTRALRTNRLAA